MPPNPPHITPAELNILKILWRVGSATVAQVRDGLCERADEAPAYTTVMTLMNQLAGKGALAVDRSRQPFVYRAVVRRESVLQQRVREFLNGVFDGQAGELVLRLVDEGALSEEDRRRIEEKIAAQETPGGSADGRAEGDRRRSGRKS
ncbi:MAG: BlaI/MecI/CopY family transcriptional regulator [Phycisphaerae bacterium]